MAKLPQIAFFIFGILSKLSVSFHLALQIAFLMLLGVISLESVFASEVSTDAINNDFHQQAPERLPQNEEKEISQVTSVSQLSDVRSLDWAFTSLQSLVERYGCIAGYPDSLYKGNRVITRFEFATGLNACLDKINELIASGFSDKVRKEDFNTLAKLQEDFASELASLKGQVNMLEAKTTQLGTQQFSTKTKLNGIAIFNVTGASAGRELRREIGQRNPVTGTPQSELISNPNTTFSGGVLLRFVTSFTGKDLLVNSIAVGNGNSPANKLASAGLSMTWGAPFTDQTIVLSAPSFGLLDNYYQFPIFDGNTQIRIGQSYWLDLFDRNRFTSIFNNGSSFNTINSPLASPVKFGTGVTLLSSLSDKFDIALGYLADTSVYNSAPNPNAGLFGGANVLSAQLTFKPSRDSNLRLLYNHSNQPALNGLVGLGGTPINGLADDGLGGSLNNAQSDTYVLMYSISTGW